MKFFFFFLLSTLPFFTSAQGDASPAHRIAFVLSPDVSFVTGDLIFNDLKQHPRLGFHTRIDGELQITNKLWARVGVGYALLRYKQSLTNLQWPSQNNNGVFQPDLPGEEYVFRFEDNMVVVPAALRYFWNSHFYSDVELGANFILNKKDVRTICPNFGLVMGWQTALGAKNFLFIQPAFRVMANKLFNASEPGTSQFPYSIGIETGMRGLMSH